ncbi:MAG: TolC family protein [Chthoniobacteraceae bacterium]
MTIATRAPGPKAVCGWLAFGLLFGGCALREKPVPPGVAVPEKFSASGKASAPDQWWRSFDDSTLNRLVDRSMADNLTLRIAWDRLAQARAVARREGAALYPAVDGSGTATRSRQVRTAGNIGNSEITEAGVRDRRLVTYGTDLSLGVTVGYEVDLWGRIRSAHDAARFDTRASEEEVLAAAMTLSASVATTWYRLVEQNGQIDLLKVQLETNERVLELITTRFQQGQVGAADVLQQRQLAESSRGAVATAEGQAAVLAHQLAILLGRPPTDRVAPRTAELFALPPLPSTGVPAALIQRRPDIRQSYFNVLASDRRISSAVAEQFPRLSLSAGVDTSGAQTRDLFDNWLATLGANLIAPLLDGGLRQAEVVRTRAVLSENLHRYGQVILESLGEVEDALAQERTQREFIVSLEKQLKFAQQALERTRDSYLNGAFDYLRVLETISSLQSLERTYLTARRELLERRIALCRALGGGWQMKAPPLARLVSRN